MTWKNAVELSNEMYCWLDSMGLLIDFNTAFNHTLQYRAEEIRGKHLTELMEAGEKDKMQALLTQMPPEHIEHFKCILINKIGEKILLNGKIRRNETQDFLISATVVIQQNALLSRFRRFFDMSLLDIVVITDRSGKILFANEGFSKTLGYSWAEIEHSALISYIHPTDYEITGEFLKGLIRTEGSSKTLINRCLCKDYSVKWISWHAIYARNHYYAVGNDITVVKQQEIRISELLTNTIQQNEELTKSRDNLQKTLEELETRNFELDQFVYKVSHDLRAPLASILGLVNLAYLDGNTYDDLMEYIRQVESSTLKLDRFLKSLIEYSRSGRGEAVVEKVDCEQMIQDIFEHLKYMKNCDRVEKKVEVRGATNFYSDNVRIRIILGNIISNAVKYQNIKAPQSYLHITLDFTDPKMVHWVFKDNGIGIAPDLIQNVFKMFFRATETSDGSGLGLYIVKQTVERLDGIIELESELHQGTTIQLWLPNKNPDLNILNT